MKMVPATRFLAALLSLLLGAPRPAGAASEAAVPGPLHLQPPLLPHPPYRMWSFAYNATTGGPECKRSQSRPVHYYCDNATADYKEELYPPNSYNLLNPAECFNTTQPQARWLAQRGVACMAWESCWNTKLAPNSTDEAVIGHFRDIIVNMADRGATAIGLDECGDLTGPHWGHLPGRIPGKKLMTLAAEGFRQGKKLRPNLFVAAWNPGSGAEPDGIFSGLVKDGTFDLAMFETYTRYPPFMIKHGGEFRDGSISQWFPRFEFARKEGWLNRSIPCLGMMFGKSAMNPTGWSHAELRAVAQELKDKFPEMPGIGFYGSPPGNRSRGGKRGTPDAFVIDLNDTATLELITYASTLSKELHPDTQITLV